MISWFCQRQVLLSEEPLEFIPQVLTQILRLLLDGLLGLLSDAVSHVFQQPVPIVGPIVILDGARKPEIHRHVAIGIGNAVYVCSRRKFGFD